MVVGGKDGTVLGVFFPLGPFLFAVSIYQFFVSEFRVVSYLKSVIDVLKVQFCLYHDSLIKLR